MGADQVVWIFLEDNFRPEAALYRKDFTPTSMGKVWEQLLTEKWHTETTTTSNKKGLIELRGFKGSYTVTILHKGSRTIMVKRGYSKNVHNTLL